MVCEGCGNKHAARIRIGYSGGSKYEICDACGASPVWLPDVYLGSGGGIRTNENLVDDNGTPIPYSSKRELAAIMRAKGKRYADSAERQHGYRNEMYLHRKKYFI